MRRATFLLTAMAVALLLGAAVVVIVQAPARANDHEPPQRPFLYKGQRELQRGNWQAYCWTYPPNPDGTYTIQCADYEGSFPAADRVGAGSELRIRILKIQRPESFSVAAWRNVDENGELVGTGRQLRSSLRRVVQDGQTVAWDVVFRVNKPGRHYYLIAGGVWEDEHVEDANQDASWTFHVRTGS
jgi:hypothetical protein